MPKTPYSSMQNLYSQMWKQQTAEFNSWLSSSGLGVEEPDKWVRVGLFDRNENTGEMKFVGPDNLRNIGLGGLDNPYGDFTLGGINRAGISTKSVDDAEKVIDDISYSKGGIDTNNGWLELIASAAFTDDAFNEYGFNPIRLAADLGQHGATTTARTLSDVERAVVDMGASFSETVGADKVAEYLRAHRSWLGNFWSKYDDSVSTLSSKGKRGVFEGISEDFADKNYGSIIEGGMGFLGKTAQDMASAVLLGTGAKAAGAGKSAMLFAPGEMALGFQAMTASDMYNGMADRDVNRLAALGASLVGSRLVAALDQKGFDVMFGGGAGVGAGKGGNAITRALGKEFFPTALRVVNPSSWLSTMKNMAVHMGNTAMTEGSTEFMQELIQAGLEETAALVGGPGKREDRWEQFKNNIFSMKMAERGAIAGGGGILFGLFGGMQSGMSARDLQMRIDDEYMPNAVAEDTARIESKEFAKAIETMARQSDEAAEFGRYLEETTKYNDTERAHFLANIEEDERKEAELYQMPLEELRRLRAEGRQDLPVIPIGQQMTAAEVSDVASAKASRGPRLSFETADERRISYEILYGDLVQTFGGSPATLADVAAITGNSISDVAEAIRNMADAGAVSVDAEGNIYTAQLLDKRPLMDATDLGWEKKRKNQYFPQVTEHETEDGKAWTYAQERELQRRKLGILAKVPMMDGAVLGGLLALEHKDMDPGVALAVGVSAALSDKNPVAQNVRKKRMLQALQTTVKRLRAAQKKGTKGVTEQNIKDLRSMAEMLAEGASSRMERLIKIKNDLLALEGATTRMSPTLRETMEKTNKSARTESNAARKRALARLGMPIEQQRTSVGSVAGKVEAAKDSNIEAIPPKAGRKKGKVEVSPNAREEVKAKVGVDLNKRIRFMKRIYSDWIRQLKNLSVQSAGDRRHEFLQGIANMFSTQMTKGGITPKQAMTVLLAETDEARKAAADAIATDLIDALTVGREAVSSVTNILASDKPGTYSKSEALATVRDEPEIEEEEGESDFDLDDGRDEFIAGSTQAELDRDAAVEAGRVGDETRLLSRRVADEATIAALENESIANGWLRKTKAMFGKLMYGGKEATHSTFSDVESLRLAFRDLRGDKVSDAELRAGISAVRDTAVNGVTFNRMAKDANAVIEFPNKNKKRVDGAWNSDTADSQRHGRLMAHLLHAHSGTRNDLAILVDAAHRLRTYAGNATYLGRYAAGSTSIAELLLHSSSPAQIQAVIAAAERSGILVGVEVGVVKDLVSKSEQSLVRDPASLAGPSLDPNLDGMESLDRVAGAAYWMSQAFTPITVARMIANMTRTSNPEMADAIGISAVSVISATAQKWAAKNKKPVYEFWHRITQSLVLRTDGGGYGGSFYNESENQWMARATTFGDRMINMALSKRHNGYASTLLHEFAHALHFSGMLYEILSESQLKTVEKMTGAKVPKVWTPSDVESSFGGWAAERFAEGFELFMAFGMANNAEYAAAFADAGHVLMTSADTASVHGHDVRRTVEGVGEKPDYSPTGVLTFTDLLPTRQELEMYAALIDEGVNETGVRRSNSIMEAHWKLISERAGIPLEAHAKWVERMTAKLAPGPQPYPVRSISFEEYLRRKGYPTEIESEALRAKLMDQYELEKSDMEVARAAEEAAALGLYDPTGGAGAVMSKKIEAGEEPDILTREELTEAISTINAADSTAAKEASTFLHAIKNGIIGSEIWGEDPRQVQKRIHQEILDGELAVTRPMGNQPGSLIARGLERVLNTAFKRQYKLGRWFDAADKMINGAIQRGMSKEAAERLSTILQRAYYHNSNTAGAASRAIRVASELPSAIDQTTFNRVILGKESLQSIVQDFGIWYDSRKKELPAPQTFDEMWGNLQLIMMIQRQLELAEQDAAETRRRLVEGGKRHGTRRAHPVQTNKMMVADVFLRMSIGEDAYHELDEFARRISQWSHDATLRKLVNAGMISEDDFDKLVAKGERYVPLNKLREVLDPNLLDIPVEDESIKDVLHYLYSDTTDVLQAPIPALVKQAAAVELITTRQLVRNAMFKGMSALYTDPHNTKYDMHMLTAPVKVGDSTVLKRVVGKEAFDAWDKVARKHESKDAYTALRARIFAAWIDGVPHYFVVRDPMLRAAIEKVSVSAMDLIIKQADAMGQSPQGRQLSFLGVVKNLTRQLIARPIVATLPFAWNSAFRDIPALFGKSRFGVGPTDLLYGAFQSLGVMFPHIATSYPSLFKHALEHLDSMSGQQGILGMIHEPAMVDLHQAAKYGYRTKGKPSIAQKVFTDYAAKAQERGALSVDALRGRLENKEFGSFLLGSMQTFWSYALSPFETLTEMQDVGWRLSERIAASRMNKEIETLPAHVRAKLGMKTGDRLAFRGYTHRIAYATNGRSILERMKKDPTYTPTNADIMRYLPRAVSDAEVDYSQRAVTVDFNQRGTMSNFLNTWELFIQPNINEFGYVVESIQRAEHRLPWLIKNMAFLSLPLLVNALLHADDDDWKALPVAEKLTYLHLRKNADGTFKRAPWGIGFAKALLADPILALWLTSQEMAPEFTARTGPVREWLTEITGVDRVWINAGAEVADRIFEQSPTTFFYSPIKTAVNKDPFLGAAQLASPAITDPLVEHLANYNFYRQEQLTRVSSFDGEEVSKNSQRHGFMQNAVAKAMGISPDHASHLLKAYLPGVRGQVLLDFPNVVAGQPEDPTAYRSMGGRGIMMNLGLDKIGKSWDPWGPQSEHVKIFLDFREKAHTLVNEINRLEKIPGGEGRIAKLYAEEPLLAMAKEIDSIYKEHQMLRDWRGAIMEDKSLSIEDQNIMMNYGGDGDNGMGPDRLMVLHAMEANRAILMALSNWGQMNKE